MDRERSWRALAALCLMKWKQLLIGALCGILAALLFVRFWNPKPVMVDNSSEADQQLELSIEDQTKIESAKGVIADDKRIVQNNQNYSDYGLIMKVNPYHKWTSVRSISVTVDNEVLQNGGSSSLQYLEEKILTQYLVSYNNIDFRSIEQLGAIHPNLDVKYWIEVISVEIIDGGILQVKAIAPSEEEAKEIADGILGFLNSKTDQIIETTCNHTLSVFSSETIEEVDYALESYQCGIRDSVIKAQEDIIKQEALIEKLNSKLTDNQENQGASKPVRTISKGRKTYALATIAGAIAGVFLAAIWVIFRCLSKEKVVVSSEIENNCEIPCLGVLSGKRTSLKSIITRLSGEKQWKSDEDAISFISGMAKGLHKGNRIVIASSLNMNETEEVQNITAALSEQGVKVAFREDILHNAEMAREWKEVDGVLLIEKALQSQMNSIDEIKQMAERFEKGIIGFVLVAK